MPESCPARGGGPRSILHPPCLALQRMGRVTPLGSLWGDTPSVHPRISPVGGWWWYPPVHIPWDSLSLGAASGDRAASSDPPSALEKLPHANSSVRELVIPSLRCQRHLGGDHHRHVRVTLCPCSGCLANTLPEVVSPMQPTLGCLGWHPQVVSYSALSFSTKRAWASPTVPAWGKCPLLSPPKGCGGRATSISPFLEMDLETVLFSCHPFWGGTSILASLSSTSHFWEECVGRTSVFLPCLDGEGVRALHVLPISEQGVCARPTVPRYTSHPQSEMSRAQSLYGRGVQPCLISHLLQGSSLPTLVFPSLLL